MVALAASKVDDEIAVAQRHADATTAPTPKAAELSIPLGDSLIAASYLHRRLSATLIAQVSRYVLRADVRFEDCSDRISGRGLVESGPDPRGPPPAGAAPGLTRMVANSRRMLLVGARATLDAALASVPSCSAADWDLAGIAEGEPLVPAFPQASLMLGAPGVICSVPRRPLSLKSLRS